MNFRRLKIAGVAVLPLTVVVASWMISLAADERRTPSPSASKAVRGEVLMITDEFLVVKEPTGKGLHLRFFGSGAKRDSTIKVGDQVEVHLTPDGDALSVTRSGASQPPEAPTKGAHAGKR